MAKKDIQDMLNTAMAAASTDGEQNPMELLGDIRTENTKALIEEPKKEIIKPKTIFVEGPKEQIVFTAEQPTQQVQPQVTQSVTYDKNVDLYTITSRTIATLDILREYHKNKIEINKILKEFIKVDEKSEAKIIHQLMTFDENIADDYCKLKEYWLLSAVDRAFYIMGIESNKLISINNQIAKYNDVKTKTDINVDKITFCKELLEILNNIPEEIINKIKCVASLLYSAQKYSEKD